MLTEAHSLQNQLASTVISGHPTPIPVLATHAAKTRITLVALPIPLVSGNSNFRVLLSDGLDPAPRALVPVRPGKRFCALMCLHCSQCPLRLFIVFFCPRKVPKYSFARLWSAHLTKARVQPGSQQKSKKSTAYNDPRQVWSYMVYTKTK